MKFAHPPFHDAERECFHSLTVAVTLWAWWAMSGLHANLWSSRAFNFIFLLHYFCECKLMCYDEYLGARGQLVGLQFSAFITWVLRIGPRSSRWVTITIAIWPASLSCCTCSPEETLGEMLYHIHLWTCKFHLSLETVFYISYILNSYLELAHPSLETELKFRFILWCNIVALWLSYCDIFQSLLFTSILPEGCIC